MPEKLCMFCEHFGWVSVRGSDYWGAEGGAECHKRHFMEYLPYDESDLRQLILRAEKCPDYSRDGDSGSEPQGDRS